MCNAFVFNHYVALHGKAASGDQPSELTDNVRGRQLVLLKIIIIIVKIR